MTPEQRLRNLARRTLEITQPETRGAAGTGRTYPHASKAEIAETARQLAEYATRYLDGTLAAIPEDAIPF